MSVQEGPWRVRFETAEDRGKQSRYNQKTRIIAEATDGLDASAAFEVAGVGEAMAFETDLGKALYARLCPTT